jgi:hypothetical protein
MKTIIYLTLTTIMGVVGAIGLLRAQPKKSPKPTPAPAVRTIPDPEEQWACGFGSRRDRNGEHCQCPAMVAEVRDEIIENCMTKHGGTQEEYIKCLGNTPSECDIVKNADLKHPAHSCSRSCSTKAICRCHDGPACRLPPLPHGEDEGNQ